MATLGHDEQYYTMRNIQLDQRGTLVIHETSQWGFNITVFTASHSTRDWKEAGFSSVITNRPVIVERAAWICSNSILYNCKICEGAIVAIGSVVRSQEVRPWTMVAGNPARVVAHYIDGAWQYVTPKWEVLE